MWIVWFVEWLKPSRSLISWRGFPQRAIMVDRLLLIVLSTIKSVPVWSGGYRVQVRNAVEQVLVEGEVRSVRLTDAINTSLTARTTPTTAKPQSPTLFLAKSLFLQYLQKDGSLFSFKDLSFNSFYQSQIDLSTKGLTILGDFIPLFVFHSTQLQTNYKQNC